MIRQYWLLVALALGAAIRAQVFYEPYSFDTVAGHSYQLARDGKGMDARFTKPTAITSDAGGNLFVVDEASQTIRKVGPDGTVTRIAGVFFGEGKEDGPFGVARFSTIRAITVDSVGNLFVCDSSGTTIRKIDTNGFTTTIAGRAGERSFADGAGADARFNWASGIAVGPEGDLYVADEWNFRIRRMSTNGLVSTFAGGAQIGWDGTTTNAKFGAVIALAFDSAGWLTVLDNTDTTGWIRRISPSGMVSTLERPDDPYSPFSNVVAVSGGGRLVVASNTIVRIDDAQHFQTIAGIPVTANDALTDGAWETAQIGQIAGMTADSEGNIYVTCPNVVRKLSVADHMVRTIAGRPEGPSYVDGVGEEARFHQPYGVAVASDGTIFVADTFGGSIRKIAPDTTVTTVVGSTNVSSTIQSRSLAMDPDGDVIFANGYQVWKLRRSGELTQIVGAGGGLVQVSGIAVNAEGVIFVSDNGSVIRKITPDGVVTALAGGANTVALVCGSSDGVGEEAGFCFPEGLAIDWDGNVLVADTGNSTIRRVTPEGKVTTVAGKVGVREVRDGAISSATFFVPYGLAVDQQMNIFVVEAGHTIRKISPDGFVTTLGGAPEIYGDANGTGAFARFAAPQGIAVDGMGTLYIADSLNDEIRKGISAPALFRTAIIRTRFGFWLSAGFSGDVVVERSSDLVNWIPVSTNTAGALIVDGTALEVSHNAYYRAISR